MLDHEQFSRVKRLYAQLCDLPLVAQHSALSAALDDAAVIDEVLLLLQQTVSDPLQAAAPLLDALSGQLLQAPRSGDALGAWTLAEEIGHGGMGKVFRAHRSDGHFQQVAAIKLLAGLPSVAALRFLTRERQILALLNHPHIARLLDGGSTSQGQPYLVMEYIEGEPIHHYCRAQSLSVAARLQLLITVCGALAHAHQQLIVHCDLKPANILVTRDGRPLLLDFGIARLLDAADRHTVERDADGAASSQRRQSDTGTAYTPRYASPEQKARQPVGTASDIYSLGLVLAELLGLDWADGGVSSTSGLPVELRAIVSRATAPERADRYSSVDALADDLKRFLTHQPVLAMPRSRLYGVHKWMRRHWRWAAVGAVFVVMLVGFSLTMRQQRDVARQAEQAARAVKDYMITVFQGADPEMSGQRELPVSELLDAGSARLAVTLADQPHTRAELTGILGGVYQGIGQRQRALELFDVAISLARAQGQDQLLAEVLHKKAYSLYDMGDFNAALPPAREALELRADGEADSVAHIASMRLVGSILGYSGETEEAPRLLGSALERATALQGPDSVEAGLAHLDLARHWGNVADQPQRVLEHADRAAANFSAVLGANHFRTADALEMRTLGLTQSGNLAAAVPAAYELLERRTVLYGETSHPRSYALHVVGSVLWRAGRHQEAAPVFVESLRIHDELDGLESVASLQPTLNLANVLEEAGAHERALALFEAQLRIHARHSVVGTVTPLRLRLHRGRNLRLLGRLAAAESELAGLRDDYRSIADADPLERVDVLIELAALRRQQGQLSAAQMELDAVDAGLLEDRQAAATAARLSAEQARLAHAHKDDTAARSLLANAQAMLSARHGGDSVQVWLLKIDEAEWRAAAGDQGGARSMAEVIAARVAPAIDPAGSWSRRLQALGAVTSGGS